MILIAASAVFAFVFIIVAMGATWISRSTEQNREVMRRMSRPADNLDVDITRKRKPEEH